MNKFNPEAIVCSEFSIDVILFNGTSLKPEVQERAQVHTDKEQQLL
jgi:hypothetical protein